MGSTDLAAPSRQAGLRTSGGASREAGREPHPHSAGLGPHVRGGGGVPHKGRAEGSRPRSSSGSAAWAIGRPPAFPGAVEGRACGASASVGGPAAPLSPQGFPPLSLGIVGQTRGLTASRCCWASCAFQLCSPLRAACALPCPCAIISLTHAFFHRVGVQGGSRELAILWNPVGGMQTPGALGKPSSSSSQSGSPAHSWAPVPALESRLLELLAVNPAQCLPISGLWLLNSPGHSALLSKGLRLRDGPQRDSLD